MGPEHRKSTRRCVQACTFSALLCGVAPAALLAQQSILERELRRPVSSSMPGNTVSSSSALPDSPGFLQAAAEAGAKVVGKIYDINGGLVPGATVTVLDKAGKAVGSATADSEAQFEVENLPPGTYTVMVSAVGLQSFQSPAFILKAGELYKLPETALPIATASQTVNVVLTQEMIADLEVADETKQRVLGIFPNFYTSYEWNAAPLNARQKFKVALRSTTDPLIFVTTAIVAGVEQYRGTYPEYGDGLEGYADRYGAQYGNAVIGRFIGSAILPTIFKQDPRYFYMGPPSTTGQRLRHALAFSVTARSDKGHDGHLMPNYSHILGNFIAGYISRTYHSGSNNGLGLAVDNALIGIGGAAVQGLTREFLFSHISSHTPTYAKGKPVGPDPAEDKTVPGTPAPAKSGPSTSPAPPSSPPTAAQPAAVPQ